MIRRIIFCVIVALAPFYVVPGVSLGADVPPVKLVIHPSAAASPALKYQLLPGLAERIRGNAAVYYGKVTAEHSAIFCNRGFFDKLERWREMPLDELRKDNIDMATGTVERMLARAARCETCDWQLPIREEPFYTILLPEVQQTRQFARILATAARVQIAKGQFDEAIETFQSGLALARNVTEGETLVNALVGAAIAGILYDQLQEFVQQPGAPNLYWALTMLPRPLISMRKAVEAELTALPLSFPELRQLDGKRSADHWQQTLHHCWETVLGFMDDSDRKGLTADLLTAASLKALPTAKHELVERGFAQATVDGMPAPQVVLIYTIRIYEEVRDDFFKWAFVSYPRGLTALDEATEHIKQIERDRPEIAPLLKLLTATPAIRVPARLDREFAILRLIEALRIHGAKHDGQLPRSLDDVTDVPLPPDPVTDKPFDYRLQGDTAIVSASPLPGRPPHYEIKMVK